jgi:hypothetical protein
MNKITNDIVFKVPENVEVVLKLTLVDSIMVLKQNILD